ncbi:MAG: YdcF family protein [Bdellovibrionales bacterium]
MSSWTQDSSADCGVVLTGGANRLKEGLDLLNQRAILKLIISGVHPRAQLREIFPQLSFYGSINENDIILEKRSLTTFGNAQQSLALVEALRCRDIVLITSQIHIHRALQTFKASFPQNFPIYERAVAPGRGESGFTEVGLEALKSLFYSLWAY